MRESVRARMSPSTGHPCVEAEEGERAPFPTSCWPGQWDHPQQLSGTFLRWRNQQLPLEANGLRQEVLWNLEMSSSLLSYSRLHPNLRSCGHGHTLQAMGIGA